MLRLNNLFNSLTGNGIDKRDANGETKLYRAVRDGNLPRVKKLLRDGADPDIADEHGLTPLHQAAYWGEADIVEQLLKAGAAANIDNGQGWTPLHSAALAGGLKSRRDVIEKLKKAGAKDDIADKHGWTPADYMALWAGNAEAAEKLRRMTGQPSAKVPNAPADAENTPPRQGGKPCGPQAPRH